jgi:hypothetical protein
MTRLRVMRNVHPKVTRRRVTAGWAAPPRLERLAKQDDPGSVRPNAWLAGPDPNFERPIGTMHHA